MRDGCKKIGQTGFSLLELLLVVSILLIVVTFVLGEFTKSLSISRRERGLADRDAQLRRALDLMSVELSQAGVTPEFTLDPTDPDSDGTKVTFKSGPLLGFNGTGAGLYPYRPITVTLPDTNTNSENLIIEKVNNACGAVPCITTTVMPLKTHSIGDYISSPMLPLMFGILNPPPLTAGTPPKLPLTATEKSVARIGFVGDIFGNGTLQYIEYAYDDANKLLYRSQTPIGQATKNAPVVLLDFVENVSFKLIYPDTATAVPIAVQISLTIYSAAPDARITGQSGMIGQTSALKVNAATIVKPHGTAAAATFIKVSNETNLRAMLPPCQTTGVTPALRYPPCDSWAPSATPAYDWWSNLYQFTQTEAYSGQPSPMALP